MISNLFDLVWQSDSFKEKDALLVEKSIEDVSLDFSFANQKTVAVESLR